MQEMGLAFFPSKKKNPFYVILLSSLGWPLPPTGDLFHLMLFFTPQVRTLMFIYNQAPVSWVICDPGIVPIT